MSRLPVLFISHGAPDMALDAERGRHLRELSDAIEARHNGRPKGIVMMSAHWLTSQPLLGTTSGQQPIIHDYHSDNRRMAKLVYPASRAPFLAEKVYGLLKPVFGRTGRKENRGLDHGIWAPLLHLYPSATVPVLQVSLPMSFEPADIVRMGETLRPLRDEGVLIIGSGGIVHNLTQLSPEGAPADWAMRFQTWVKESVAKGDISGLYRFAEHPDAALAHPTPEHFLPLFFCVGAAGNDSPQFIADEFEYGNLSRLCVKWE